MNGHVTRRQLCGAVTAGAAVAVAACVPVGSGGSGAAPPSTSGKQPVTLVWSPWDGEGQAIVDGANKGIALYRQSHGNVSFDLVPQQGFSAKVDAMIAADSGPDILSGNGAGWRNRAVQGQFLGLDPFVKRDMKANWKDDYVPAHIAWYSSKEKGLHSLPMYLGTMALYYNKGWFRSKGVAVPDASWDWDKWQAGMQKLTERPEKFGASLLTIGGLPRADTNILRANNGYMTDPNDDTKCVLDQPPALAGLQWLRDRYWKDHVSIQNGETGGQNATTLFSAGKIAMFIEGSWRLAPMALEVPPGVEWDMAVVPKKLKRSTLATTDGWGIWRGTKHPDESWQFMRWLQGDDWHEIMMSVVGLTPARISQVDKWTSLVVKAYPALQGKNVQAFTAPAKEKWADPGGFFRFHKEALDILTPVFIKSVRDGEDAVDSAFKEAAKQVNAVQAQLKASTGK